MEINRSSTHELLARSTPDEQARADFIIGLKRHLRAAGRQNQALYAQSAEPRFRAFRGRAPATLEEVREAISGELYYRLWSALSRRAQEMMWESVESMIARQMPRMREAAKRLTRAQSARGSLQLDPTLAPPADLATVPIHCQPGGYLRDDGAEDLMAGALYECGGNLYSSGVGIGPRDSKAGAVIRHLAARFPAFRPRRILDLGCSAGGASVGYAASYPDAEVHAVDAGPALLRYAHARAEALGVAIHFHQMDVRRLGFPDESFDLIVSHNLMHEISRESMQRLFAECYRLLQPGGMTVHQDVPIKGPRTLFERFMFDWETRYNNEPFWQVFAEADVPRLLVEAGFASDRVSETEMPKLDGPGAWYLALAGKSAAS